LTDSRVGTKQQWKTKTMRAQNTLPILIEKRMMTTTTRNLKRWMARKGRVIAIAVKTTVSWPVLLAEWCTTSVWAPRVVDTVLTPRSQPIRSTSTPPFRACPAAASSFAQISSAAPHRAGPRRWWPRRIVQPKFIRPETPQRNFPARWEQKQGRRGQQHHCHASWYGRRDGNVVCPAWFWIWLTGSRRWRR
jgi:hypothetical protein